METEHWARLSEREASSFAPKSYACKCSPGSEAGSVLLFYRYYANHPELPSEHDNAAKSPRELAGWHQQLADRLHLTGKLRIAREGFNVTIAGTASCIDQYISSCSSHWSFTNIDLPSSAARRMFFKPTPGCSCVFPSLSIKVCAEITPMGVTNYTPTNWRIVRELEPPQWHAMISGGQGNVTLLDVRNHYESSLGHFVDARGREAVRPQVRRFSQFPQYVMRRKLDIQLLPHGNGKKKVLTYCTGGIRCEKATRFLQDKLPVSVQEVDFFTLKGGIVAYLSWVDVEIMAGRMAAKDSLFKGKSYVFDERRSIGLEGGNDDVVGRCIGCTSPADAVQKCNSANCNLELILCPDCISSGVSCCQDCEDLDATTTRRRESRPKPMCRCERDREANLWHGCNDQHKSWEEDSKSRRKRL